MILKDAKPAEVDFVAITMDESRKQSVPAFLFLSFH
jgi:hypothetical protein